MPIATINPATGETLKTFEPLTDAEIDQKLTQAVETFQAYHLTTFEEREPLMARAAEILESEKNDLGRLMTTEMGKPIKAAEQEVEKCAWVCRYYAEQARHHLADEVVQTNASKSYVKFEPLGPILAVMP
ncbi:MAG TPA: aldehyde dehydrogenase family protein, partial [Pyrinomonadaceae bacterium]|nr:aldehyde dehydrogenase family protein [Pyrinomonadaceae bacterium]